MRTKYTVLFLTLVLSAAAADVTIETDRLSVTADGPRFSIKSAKTGNVFVPQARLPKPVTETRTSAVSSPKWGKGKEILFTHEDGSRTSLQIFEGASFAALHTSVHNSTKEALKLQSLDVLDMDISLGDRKLVSYGTGGLKNTPAGPGSYAFHVHADPETRNGVVAAWLTHERGIGVLLPHAASGKTSLKAKLDFGLYQVNPGATRQTDTLLIGYFDDARIGLELYASAVASHYDIRLKPKPGVYCTWYHGGASNEKQIAANTEFAAGNLKPFGLGVMQIDDKWQAPLPKGFKHSGKIPKTGPIKVFVDTQGNYPSGMAHTAKAITSCGMTAGIWFMPFAGNFRNPYFDPAVFAKNPDGTPFHDARWSGTCIDASHPKGLKFIYDRTKRIYDWGYRYFKIDGMHTGIPSNNIYVHTAYRDQNLGKAKLHDPNTTHAQAYRKALAAVRRAAPDAFILGCNVSQNMISMGPAFGMIDAMRIGPDNGSAGRGSWGAVTKGAWHGTNLYFLNGRIWHNDPDPVYVRKSNPIEMARWMCSWLAVTGSMHTSSMQYATLPADRLDILKRCLPGHTLPARPADLFETDKPRIWLVRNERMDLIGLFNWQHKEEASITYDLKKLGLDKSKTYIAFDYWKNRLSSTIKGSLSQTLPGATCRILALKPESDHPQLISTSRHITQGLIDVLEENWAGMTLSGESRVVGNDPYELRIALPARGNWKAVKAAADGADIKLGTPEKALIRATITTPASKTVAWRISFENRRRHRNSGHGSNEGNSS